MLRGSNAFTIVFQPIEVKIIQFFLIQNIKLKYRVISTFVILWVCPYRLTYKNLSLSGSI